MNEIISALCKQAIVLMNVLGAMFFKTYADIQAESYELGQKLRFELILEYRSMPPVPAPFALLWNISIFFRFLLRSLLPRMWRTLIDRCFAFLDIRGKFVEVDSSFAEFCVPQQFFCSFQLVTYTNM